jgi:MoaA/NifB/PqqE/SkfB family radical SAM enzyme
VEQLDYASFGRRLYRQAARDRRPISGSLALTYRCNLSCVHCYLDGARRQPEISTAGWLAIIEQLEPAGCLWLLLTGGEPLLRPDFAEIYLAAKRRGMLVIVFTNGTLVDEAVVELWREWPPHAVEITLYGYSAATYGRITGHPEAREKVYDAVARLARAGVPMRLKTMALRQNVEELDRLRDYSAARGLPFRFDGEIAPTLNGSLKPWDTRLPAERIVELELADSWKREAWRSYLEWAGQPKVQTTLFQCGGGRVSFFVDPAGQLGLCLFDRPLVDLTREPVAAGWSGALRRRREETLLPADHPCNGCPGRVHCEICPPLARMACGDEQAVPEPACELGRCRERAWRDRQPTREHAP